MNEFFLAFAVAVMIEAAIEALKPALDPLFDRLPDGVRPYLYLSLAAGVVLSFIYSLDILALAGLAEPTAAATALTGLVVGRGANYLHDVVSRFAG